MQLASLHKSDSLPTILNSPHTPRILSTTVTTTRNTTTIRSPRPKLFTLQPVSPLASLVTEPKVQGFAEQLDVDRKAKSDLRSIHIPLLEVLSPATTPAKKSAFYSHRSRPSSPPAAETSEAEGAKGAKQAAKGEKTERGLDSKNSSVIYEGVFFPSQRKRPVKEILTGPVSRDGSVTPKSPASATKVSFNHSNSFKASAFLKKADALRPYSSQLKILQLNSEDMGPLETEALTPGLKKKPSFKHLDVIKPNNKQMGDLNARYRFELKKGESFKLENKKLGPNKEEQPTSPIPGKEHGMMYRSDSGYTNGSPVNDFLDMDAEFTPVAKTKRNESEVFRPMTTRAMDSPIKDLSAKMQEFLWRKQEKEKEKEGTKTTRGGGLSCDARLQEDAYKSRENSMTERMKFNGTAYDIWNDDYPQSQAIKIPRRADKMFVTKPTDFFQINPGNKTYKEFIEVFNEDLKSAEDQEKLERRMPEEKRITKEDYKPMMIWFGEGSRIVQPKYMTGMGSMCYTELWPKKLNQRMQKQLVKGGDYLRMSDGGRNFETVYRPKKWHKEDENKKRHDGTKQAVKNGHEAEMRSSSLVGQHGRASKVSSMEKKK